MMILNMTAERLTLLALAVLLAVKMLLVGG